MAETEAQKRAREKYEAKTKVQVLLKLNRNTDSDILEKLEKVDSKQGYIKSLIRADIKQVSAYFFAKNFKNFPKTLAIYFVWVYTYIRS